MTNPQNRVANSAGRGIPTGNLFLPRDVALVLAAVLQRDHRPFTAIRVRKLAASDG